MLQAIGAQATYPDRQVISMSGDGGFLKIEQFRLTCSLDEGAVVTDTGFTLVRNATKHSTASRRHGIATQVQDRIACGILYQREDIPHFYDRLIPRQGVKTTCVEEVRRYDVSEYWKDLVQANPTIGNAAAAIRRWCEPKSVARLLLGACTGPPLSFPWQRRIIPTVNARQPGANRAIRRVSRSRYSSS